MFEVLVRSMISKAHLRLKVRLTTEIEADDFYEVAEHRRQLERLLTEIRVLYPAASLTVIESRNRRRKAPQQDWDGPAAAHPI